MSATPPPGFVVVTEDQFYAAMGPLDVHPNPHPEHSSWELRDRRLVGWSAPGYRNTWSTAGQTPKVYALSPGLAARLNPEP